MSLSLTLLGTGTPTPLVHRGGSSYLVRLDDEMLLFDCGPACVRRLLRKGISPTRIDTLFLTHLHYDHFVDYPYFVLLRWDQGAGRIPDLDVYAPAPARKVTDRLFADDGAFDPDLTARTGHPVSQFIYEMRGGALPRARPMPRVTEVAAGSEVGKGRWRVTATEVVHVQPQLICLAYRFEAEGKSIVFGGDTAPTQSLTDLARDADVLLHMCHFVNGEADDPRNTCGVSGHLDAARTAAAANVRTLVLVHMTEQVEQPGVKERVLHEVGEVFPGQVIFGEDLLDIPVDPIEVPRIR
ncbi:MAG: MBL fold metallo-hydrolase [Phycisphaeraceae bacterium]|nr:MBL fold metallo-hydrolase [Phycisphaeraceae bacterium]